jgi:hypothetical protein
VWKGLKYKYWSPGALQPAVKYKRPTDKEITEVMKYIFGELTIACMNVKYNQTIKSYDFIVFRLVSYHIDAKVAQKGK